MPESVICPLPTALTTVPAETCRDIFGKAAKFIFQRALVANYFDESASPPTTLDDADDWSGLADASDGTKIVVTPILENVVFGEQDIFTNGENLDGAPNNVGTGTTPVSAQVRNPTPGESDALRELKRETLWVYVIDQDGNFLARLVSGSVGTDAVVSGFPLSPNTFQTMGPTREGTASDQFMLTIMFNLKYNWYDTAVYIAPEAGFDPLTAIVPS